MMQRGKVSSSDAVWLMYRCRDQLLMYRCTEHEQEIIGGKRDEVYFFFHPITLPPPSPPLTPPTPRCSSIPQKSDQEQLGTRQLNKWVLIMNSYFLLLLRFRIIASPCYLFLISCRIVTEN